MKQRGWRRQPSPVGQVFRRAQFWVLWFFSLALSPHVSVFVVCVSVCVCECACARNGPEHGVCVCSCPLRALLCVPLPTIVNSRLLVHSWLEPADGLVVVLCVCVSGRFLVRGGWGGGDILAYLSVPFYWWRGRWVVCAQNKLWWRQESELCVSVVTFLCSYWSVGRVKRGW